MNRQGFLDHSEFITQQTQNFTKKYPNSYLTTQTDPKLINSSASGLGVIDPNTRQLTQNNTNIQQLLIPIEINNTLKQQHQQCLTSDIDTLIGSQNLNSKVRCGWVYQKGNPGNNPVVSQGVLGTRNGPMAFFDNPKGTYYWNLDDAKKQILKDRCRSLVSCSDVGRDEYKECAFSSTRGSGIPVDARGNSRYPRDSSLSAPSSSLITSSANCPKPPPPGSPEYVQQQSRDVCTPLPDGKLSRDCILEQITAAGCKEDGSLYQQLLTSAQPNNYMSGLANTISYKTYQQSAPIPLSESIIRDGSTTKNIAVDNIRNLKTQSSTVDETAVNYASRDLCLKQGTMDSYDFCSDLKDTSLAPFNLICLQKAFRKLGGQPSGSSYPTEANKAKYDAFGTWKAVMTNMTMLANTALAKSDSFIDASTQKRALTQLLGIRRDPLDNSYTHGDNLGEPAIFNDSGGAMQRFRLWINKNLEPNRPASFLEEAFKRFKTGEQINIVVKRASDNNERKFLLTHFNDGGYYWEVISSKPDAYQYGAFYKNDDIVTFRFEKYVPPYEALGCWKDTRDRALVNYMGDIPINECYKKAIETNNKYFAMQFEVQCWMGNSGYDKHGKHNGTCPMNGLAWVNNVYKNDKYIPPPPPPPMMYNGCENQSVNLRCPAGEIITGGTVKIGRWDSSTCPGPGVNDNTIKKSVNYDIPGQCFSKNSCQLQVGNNLYGDNYPGVYKHWGIDIKCEKGMEYNGCENDQVNITCPAGQSITGGTVKIGRWDRGSCPGAGVNQNTELKSVSHPMAYQCIGKNNCQLQVGNHLYGDDYPGVRKQWGIDKTCAPSSSETYTGCENGKAEIKCPSGQVIKGGTVKIGRWDFRKCQGPGVSPFNAPRSKTHEMPSECLGKTTCDLTVGNSKFGDDYPGVYKQWEVVSRCG